MVQVQEQFRGHLKSMFEDRAVDARVNEISKQSLLAKCSSKERILSISMDGMDQCKFRIPRITDTANKDPRAVGGCAPRDSRRVGSK